MPTFRVHLETRQGTPALPALVAARTTDEARSEALRRHPGYMVRKVKRDRSPEARP